MVLKLWFYCVIVPAKKSLFRREKDKVRVNVRTQTGFHIKTFYFEWVDADLSLFSLLLAFYFTVNQRRLALKQFSRDLQPIFAAKSAALIGTQANKEQGMFP